MWDIGSDTETDKRRRRARLAWLLSLLLLLLPYTGVLKAASALPEGMPCHQHMPAAQQHTADDCLHDLADTGCHCCQLQAPASMVNAMAVKLSLAFLISIETPRPDSDFPTPPLTSHYRPPIPAAS